MQTGTCTADAFVGRSREYIGTPFRHQGRAIGRGGGVDCVGLVLCVGEDLALVDRLGAPLSRRDYPGYNPQPTDNFVHLECRRRLLEKPLVELVDADVLTIRIPHLPTHAAIVAIRAGIPYIIHAYSGGTKKVVEHILSEPWRRRIVGVFAVPGVAR